MREGDVVWWYARRLRSALAGHVLTRSDLRVPRFATADLTGRMVTQVTSRGRHLFIRVDGGVSVHTHLRMDGAWRIRPAAELIPASHRIRLVLGNASWTALGYQLGVVEASGATRRSATRPRAPWTPPSAKGSLSGARDASARLDHALPFWVFARDG